MNPQINTFIVKYQNSLAKCQIFDCLGKDLCPAVRRVVPSGRKKQEMVIIERGMDERYLKYFNDQKQLAQKPLPIHKGGLFSFIIKLRIGSDGNLEYPSYSFRFTNLTKSVNGVHSFRFDKDVNIPRGCSDWDENMADAPSHPCHHLHVNFSPLKNSEDYTPDNTLRLPTGPINPLIILPSIDHWYWQRLCN